jgi:hypothetical protein
MNYEQAKPYGGPFATSVMVIQIYFVVVSDLFHGVVVCLFHPLFFIDYQVSELNRSTVVVTSRPFPLDSIKCVSRTRRYGPSTATTSIACSPVITINNSTARMSLRLMMFRVP